ncbi:MAG: helix-hairpin-helix domain-containing protein, partial [Pseudomonadota bacterium]
ELQSQREALENEISRLQDLLAANPDWRTLRAIESGLSDGLYRDSDRDNMHQRRAELHRALAENRIYSAYTRLTEAVQLMREEEAHAATWHTTPLGQASQVSEPSLTRPQTSSNAGQRCADQKTGAIGKQRDTRQGPLSGQLPADLSGQSRDQLPVQQQGQSSAPFKTRVKVKIHAGPPGVERSDTDNNSPHTAPRDDLTRIRGITTSIAADLNGLGVTSWREIADWRRDDVQMISAALQLNGQISNQNWIEQAAVLALSQQSSASHTPKATATEPADELTSRQPETAQTTVDQTTVAQTASPTAFGQPDIEPQPTAGAARTGMAKTSAREATQRDDLCAIKGVDVATAEALQQQGITTFQAISDWSVSEVAAISIQCELGARIGVEGWIEQAAILAEGRPTAFSAGRHLHPSKVVSPDRYALETRPQLAISDRLRKAARTPKKPIGSAPGLHDSSQPAVPPYAALLTTTASSEAPAPSAVEVPILPPFPAPLEAVDATTNAAPRQDLPLTPAAIQAAKAPPKRPSGPLPDVAQTGARVPTADVLAPFPPPASPRQSDGQQRSMLEAAPASPDRLNAAEITGEPAGRLTNLPVAEREALAPEINAKALGDHADATATVHAQPVRQLIIDVVESDRTVDEADVEIVRARDESPALASAERFGRQVDIETCEPSQFDVDEAFIEIVKLDTDRSVSTPQAGQTFQARGASGQPTASTNSANARLGDSEPTTEATGSKTAADEGASGGSVAEPVPNSSAMSRAVRRRLLRV